MKMPELSRIRSVPSDGEHKRSRGMRLEALAERDEYSRPSRPIVKNRNTFVKFGQYEHCGTACVVGSMVEV